MEAALLLGMPCQSALSLRVPRNTPRAGERNSRHRDQAAVPSSAKARPSRCARLCDSPASEPARSKQKSAEASEMGSARTEAMPRSLHLLRQQRRHLSRSRAHTLLGATGTPARRHACLQVVTLPATRNHGLGPAMPSRAQGPSILLLHFNCTNNGQVALDLPTPRQFWDGLADEKWQEQLARTHHKCLDAKPRCRPGGNPNSMTPCLATRLNGLCWCEEEALSEGARTGRTDGRQSATPDLQSTDPQPQRSASDEDPAGPRPGAPRTTRRPKLLPRLFPLRHTRPGQLQPAADSSRCSHSWGPTKGLAT